MNRPVRTGLAALAGLVLLAVLVVVIGVWNELRTPYASWSGDGVTVELPRGADAGTLMGILGENGVLKRPGLLAAWVRWGGDDGALQAGEYRFEEPLSPLEVLEILRQGHVVLHEVTLPEGLTMEVVADRIAGAGFAGATPILDHMRDPAPILDLDPDATDLEGYLFPDTYRFPSGEEPEAIVGALVARFREVVGPGYAERARDAGLTVREAVTLASMIEKETSLPEERWKISRVFHNRLDRGMLLQCDPTVIYAIRRTGVEIRRLSIRDLEFDSPWNTYRVAGLPPGPICSPGRDSLDAAVTPAEGKELYFVASPDGGHRFSRDLESHLEAVRQWRRYVRSSR